MAKYEERASGSFDSEAENRKERASGSFTSGFGKYRGGWGNKKTAVQRLMLYF